MKTRKKTTQIIIISFSLTVYFVMSFIVPTIVFANTAKDQPSEWAAGLVQKAIEDQLIPLGMQNDYTKTITREEYCILAIRLIEAKVGMTITEYLDEIGVKLAPEDTFTDCKTLEVLAARALEIVNGTSKTTFEPKLYLNREMAVAFLAQTAEACGQNVTFDTHSYEDVAEISDWAKEYTGYLYDLGVIKGKKGNQFDPKGNFQRQQAFITIYNMGRVIDQIDIEKMKVKFANHRDISIEELSRSLTYKPYETPYKAVLVGTRIVSEMTTPIRYEVYYKNGDIKIDNFYNDFLRSTYVFNQLSYRTYSLMYMGTHYGHVSEDNQLPLKFLTPDMFREIQSDPSIQDFQWYYDQIEDDRVLYLKTLTKDGILTERWYSLKYYLPVKFHQEWEIDNNIIEVNWELLEIDESIFLEDSIFEIPDIESSLENGLSVANMNFGD
ncbi:S-layer homology domain-containing protein [Fusibacter bizertensis]|uniref:S-layer homology domain-containing protein n=1 Tax=Fusibacter bizertensis TaxID=1488331 RepID=A0ABT6N8U1_9FIRM|nr:S-layer homology domain-containing protein [Fusibacter bizertensis]MDH8676836.1 S-layer homology domain-containing protein [Fusibacter bizertensis]